MYLDLKTKKKILDYIGKGKSEREAAKKYNVGKGTIGRIKDNRIFILKLYEDEINHKNKHLNPYVKHEQIDETVFIWLSAKRRKNAPIDGPILREIALKFAEEFQINGFVASSGWLERFKKRHNISFRKICGERLSADKISADDFINGFTNLRKNYKDEDIFNLDETSIIIKILADSSFIINGEDCSGFKNFKDRLTLVLCVNINGESFKPIIIGKSGKPRCFKNKNVDLINVNYKSSRKGWMTNKLFIDILNEMNDEMIKQSRKILLILDNAPSHGMVEFSNIELLFLPKNTTSLIQPLDMGIIKSLKIKYKRILTKHVLFNENEDWRENLKSVDLVDVMIWIETAFDQIDKETFRNCFIKSGLFRNENETKVITDVDDEQKDCWNELDEFFEIHEYNQFESVIDENLFQELAEDIIWEAEEKGDDELLEDVGAGVVQDQIRELRKMGRVWDCDVLIRKMYLELEDKLKNKISSASKEGDIRNYLIKRK